jgi:hypothetical protein
LVVKLSSAPPLCDNFSSRIAEYEVENLKNGGHIVNVQSRSRVWYHFSPLTKRVISGKFRQP